MYFPDYPATPIPLLRPRAVPDEIQHAAQTMQIMGGEGMLTSSELDQAITASWDRQLDWLKTLVGFPSQRGLEGGLPPEKWSSLK
ncbi:hypothetical protein E3U26_18865 (plasmid) [Paracoccus ferrooxidans]|nr:hypothetical protein E3U26_18865 [Paracoccus ferrooxidans]